MHAKLRKLSKSGGVRFAASAAVCVCAAFLQGCDTAEDGTDAEDAGYSEGLTEALEEEVAARTPEIVEVEPEPAAPPAQVPAAEAPASQEPVHATLTRAVAVLQPTEGNSVTGTVTFTQTDDGVEVEAHINGLSPGKHGFHIHEFGDLSAPDGTSAGGHFNPEGHPHAGPDAAERHVGDLGNLEAGEDGHAMYKRTDTHLTLTGPNTIISRSVVVHGGEDDLTSQPSGDAGARVAAGIIGIAQGNS